MSYYRVAFALAASLLANFAVLARPCVKGDDPDDFIDVRRVTLMRMRR
jgi:hypothetical protein